MSLRAIILAAGRGRRMGAATEFQPKCCTVVRGRPLIEWQLEALRHAGATEIAVVRGYRADWWDTSGLALHRYFTNERWATTQMVVSLQHASEWLEHGPCLVSYSDIFYSGAAAARLAACPDDIAITYDPHWLALWSRRFANPLDDAETFRVDAEGRVLEIGGRATTVAQIEGQFMGLLRFTPGGWATVTTLLAGEPSIDRLDMTSLLARLIAAGALVRGVPIDDEWGEIDSLSDLATVRP